MGRVRLHLWIPFAAAVLAVGLLRMADCAGRVREGRDSLEEKIRTQQDRLVDRVWSERP